MKNTKWSVGAGICLVCALISWALDRADASFVFATLGVLAWFMNLRGMHHRANAERELGIGGEE